MVLAVGVATCRIGDLISSPQGALLFVAPASPDSLKDSSAFGSTAPRIDPVNIENKGDGDLQWTARLKHLSPWVTLDPDTGTAAQTPPLQVIFDPSGLDSGVYQDTVTVSARSGAAAFDVPLWYNVHSCRSTPISLGDSVATSLTTADCAAPHRAGRFARLFNFTGNANDSVSVEVSAGFDAYVAVDTSLAASHPPLNAADDCLGASGNPCLYYNRLPYTATYYVEVTSADSADTGAFTMRLVHQRRPNTPTSLDQRLTDSVTSVGIGDTVTALSLLLRAVVSDSDLGDSLHLEAEVRPIGVAFSGPNVPNGPKVANGQPAWVSTGTLSDKTSYHWRVRAGDNTGRQGDWGSLVGNTDFTINIPHPPNAPSALAQSKPDGTPINVAGTADTDVVVLSASVSDQDPGDQLRLQVEVQPIGTAFTNNPTDSSPPVSGGVAQVSVGPLGNNTNYHWQARTTDQTGLASSPWTKFGNNTEAQTDFRIQLANVPNAPTALLQFQSDGSTSLPLGGVTAANSVVLKATVSDPDVGQSVQLEVEVKPTSVAFTNVPNYSSTAVTSPAQATVSVGPLSNNTDYHWQARAKDVTNRTGAWVSFPQPTPNPENQADFSVQQPPSELFFSSQPPASTTAGAVMAPAIQVAARDINHNVSTGFTGNVVMTLENAPGASLSGPTTVAAVNGVATFNNLFITKAGSGYVLRATTSAPSLTQTSSSFTIAPAAPAQLVFTVQPSNATAGVAIAPAIQVSGQDTYGNPTSSFAGLVTMTIAANPGNPAGTLGGTTGVTASSGVATFSNLSIDKVGVGYTLRAGATGMTPDTSVAFTITPGVATHLAFTVNPANTAANATISPPVQVSGLDANNNLATTFGGSVTVAIGTNPPGNGILSGMKTAGASSGVATFSNLSIDKIGNNYTLTATSTVTGATSQPFNIVNSQVDPNQSSVVASPGTITASNGASQSTITVTARDNGGNPVAGVSATLTVTGTGNTVTPAGAVITNGSGVATWTLSSTVAETKTVSSVAGGISITQAASVTVNPGPATTLAFTPQPTNTPGGAAINGGSGGLVVTARDQFGNTATSFGAGLTMAIAAGPVGGVFAPTTTNTATASAGMATFPQLRIYKAGGGYQLQASGGGLTSPLSNAFSITVGSLNKVGFVVQPVTTADSAPITPAVQVAGQDSVGNTVTSFNGLVRMFIGQVGGGGALSGTTQVNANGTTGVATFSNLRINAMGTGYTLLTTSTGLASDESVPFDIIAGSASKLIFSGQPGSSVAGQAITPTVQVTAQDNQGNTATSFGGNVTLGIGTNPPGNGGLTGGGPLAASAGVVSFPAASIDKAGNGYTLIASSGGLTGATSALFNVAPGGVSASLSTISRAPTSIAASAGTITSTITVTAKDGLGNPIQGLAVVLAATGTGNTLTQPAALTNASGVATGTLSSTVAETKTVSATIDGTPINATTTVVVNPAAPKLLLFNVQPNNTVAGQIIRSGTGVQVEVRDTFNNRVTTASNSVGIAILNNAGSGTLSGTTPRTPVGGIVTFNDLSIDKIGTGYTLLTSATGLVSETSAGFNITVGGISASLSTVVAAQASITACDNSPPCSTGNGTASQITVTARDGSGNPVAGASVTLSATGSSNGFSPAGPYTTDGSGVATALFRSTVAEGKTISATINSTSINQTAAVTVTAAGISAATSTLGASPGTITASNGSSTSTITATAKDEFGNLIQGLTVVLASSGTGNTVTQPGSTTNGSGQATGTLGLDQSRRQDRLGYHRRRPDHPDRQRHREPGRRIGQPNQA